MTTDKSQNIEFSIFIYKVENCIVYTFENKVEN